MHTNLMIHTTSLLSLDKCFVRNAGIRWDEVTQATDRATPLAYGISYMLDDFKM